MEFSPFENVGCPLAEHGYARICGEESELYALGCDRLYEAPDMMGGLTPAYPMAVCHYMPYYRPDVADWSRIPQSEYFFNVGGPMPELVRYLVFKDGNFQLIKNPEEFRAAFAPVESADEALGFTLALDSLYAEYDQKADKNNFYEVETLEDTHVEVTGGYLVHVFDYQFFGCGPHYYYAVEKAVKRDGAIQEESRTKIFRDPRLDDLCQD